MERQIAIPSLLKMLAQMPDPRKPRGKRHPLPAILGLACAAALCGYTSLYAIAQWGREHGAWLARALGFTRDTTPCVATLHNVFKALDVKRLEALLSQWAEEVSALVLPPDAREALALDGKTLRGSRRDQAPALHIVAAVSHRLRQVMAQQGVPEGSSELAIALALLKGLEIEGKVVTLDAGLAQKEICKAIVEKGGEYLAVIKGNHPEQWEDIAFLFENISPSETS